MRSTRNAIFAGFTGLILACTVSGTASATAPAAAPAAAEENYAEVTLPARRRSVPALEPQRWLRRCRPPLTRRVPSGRRRPEAPTPASR